MTASFWPYLEIPGSRSGREKRRDANLWMLVKVNDTENIFSRVAVNFPRRSRRRGVSALR